MFSMMQVKEYSYNQTSLSIFTATLLQFLLVDM